MTQEPAEDDVKPDNNVWCRDPALGEMHGMSEDNAVGLAEVMPDHIFFTAELAPEPDEA